MNALITGVNPVPGVTAPRRAIHSTPAMPATTPDAAKAIRTTRFARMPRSRATSKSAAEARNARPTRVRWRIRPNTSSVVAATTSVTTGRTPSRTGPRVMVRSSTAGTANPWGRGEMICRARFWMMTDTAKLVNSNVVNDAPRRGRNATRSIISDVMPAAMTPTSPATAQGMPRATIPTIVYPVTVMSSP